MRLGLFGGERGARKSDANDPRRAGDRARDMRDWSEAAQCYARHLKAKPEDFAIWVQFGNCRKELGDYRSALEAYEAAIRLDENDADVHLQKGHALKLAGRLPDAIAAYRRSLECRGEKNPALIELAALAPDEVADLAPRDAVIEAGARTIYLDVTDLADYLRVNTTLSGIQRVVSNLAIHSRDCGRSTGAAVNFVIPDYRAGDFFVVGASLVEAAIATVTAGNSDRSTLDKLIAALDRSKRAAEPKAGDVVVIAGAFWIHRHYELINKLRARGVSIVVFIHDLIQARNPEYVHKQARDLFRHCFNDIAVVADKIVTSSNFVAGEVRRYIEEKLNFEVEVDVVPLATEFTRARQSAVDEFAHLRHDGFVLCVGTIEVRKNHLYLIRIWERLIREFNGRIPNLVFVGKRGWDIEDLREYLENSDYLGARLFIYDELPDSGLAWLYENCLITIYPSFAEGWGLPVSESLAFGKPCVASNTTSLPEIGGPLCKYVDPHDVEDGYKVVSAVLADPKALADWAATIRKTFKPKTWRAFSEELYGAAVAGAKKLKLEDRQNNCLIETGIVAPFGAAALAELDAKEAKLISARMSRVSGWHELETWGSWASERRAVLRFRTRLMPGAQCIAYLHLRTPEESNLADCVVKSGELTTRLEHVGSTPGWRAARCMVGERGVVEMTLLSGKGFKGRGERETGGGDQRERYIGVIALAIAPADDPDARRRIVNAIVPEG